MLNNIMEWAVIGIVSVFELIILTAFIAALMFWVGYVIGIIT